MTGRLIVTADNSVPVDHLAIVKKTAAWYDKTRKAPTHDIHVHMTTDITAEPGQPHLAKFQWPFHAPDLVTDVYIMVATGMLGTIEALGSRRTPNLDPGEFYAAKHSHQQALETLRYVFLYELARYEQWTRCRPYNSGSAARRAQALANRCAYQTAR